MRRQSLRVAWREFAEACGQLTEWRAFALWVRAIVEAERGLPKWLKKRIDQRCPGFLEARMKVAGYESIWLDLSAWVEDQVFTAARDAGWLEALHYYSGQDPQSEQIWSQWTRTEAEWRNNRPAAYPPFEKWHQEALKTSAAADDNKRARSPLPDAAKVQGYIEWEAFAFWARTIVESAGEIPAHLAVVLEQRCPGFVDRLRGERARRAEYSTWLWGELLTWIEAHAFADMKAASCLDAVRSGARTHFRGERIAEYWVDCSSRWRKNPPAAYPGFERWLRDADAFVVK